MEGVSMNGLGLLKTLIEATGLPHGAVEREMNELILKNGLDPERLSLEDVRNLLSSYLLDVMTDAKRTLCSSAPNAEKVVGRPS
jgi:hypothetical protein